MEESCRCQVYLSSNGFQTFWQTVSLQNTLRQTRSLDGSGREQSPVCRLMWVRTDLTLGLASRTTSLPKCQQAELEEKETMAVTSHKNCWRVNTQALPACMQMSNTALLPKERKSHEARKRSPCSQCLFLTKRQAS